MYCFPFQNPSILQYVFDVTSTLVVNEMLGNIARTFENIIGKEFETLACYNL
jgi:hypothetical protein